MCFLDPAIWNIINPLSRIIPFLVHKLGNIWLLRYIGICVHILESADAVYIPAISHTNSTEPWTTPSLRPAAGRWELWACKIERLKEEWLRKEERENGVKWQEYKVGQCNTCWGAWLEEVIVSLRLKDFLGCFEDTNEREWETGGASQCWNELI